MAATATDYMCGATLQPSGILLLKLILTKSAAQARTVASFARHSIMNLPTHMKDVSKGDIMDLHSHLEDLLAQLHSANEESTDVIVSLFTAYKTCTHEDFLHYIGRLEDEYEADTTNSVTLTVIKARVETKFNKLKLLNEWEKPSKRDSQLFALQSRIDRFVAERTRRRNRTADAPTRPAAPPANTRGNPNARTGDSKFHRIKPPAWRKVAPAPGEPHTKVVNGELWHFCTHHGYWVKHTSEECRDKNPSNQQETDEIRASMADIGVEEASDDKFEDTYEE